jgi:hypothetical protein
MHQLSDEFLNKWEHIIKGVDMTDLPLECIKKVTIKLQGNRRRTINIALLKRQGLEIDQIEELLNKTLTTYNGQIRDLDWLIDVKAVADIIQPETDRLLKDIK